MWRSSGASTRGWTTASRGAPVRRGTSGCASTRGRRLVSQSVSHPSGSSSGSRRRTTPRSPSRLRCSAGAPTRSSPSCGKAIRAGRSSCASRRSGRSSRTRASSSTAIRPPRSSSTPTRCARSCGRRCPDSRSSASPYAFPREWVSSPSRVRVNLVASSSPATSSGFLTRDAIASFDWRLAIGDVELSEEELRELAAAKEPLIRLRGKWHALQASEVERALRFLDGRGRSAGVVELVRAVSGLETDEAGIELGDVRLDATLDDLLAGAERPALPGAAHPGRHAPRPLSVPGTGSRLAAPARRHAGRRDPGRRHGARKDRAGDRDARLGARGRRSRRRPDARRQPDERRPAMGARDRPFRARAARPPPPRAVPPGRRGLCRNGGVERRRGHLVRRRDERCRPARGGRVGPAAARRGAGREESPDEAPPRAASDPAAADAGAHRDADREPAGGALGDHGPGQPRPARHARGVRARPSPARSRRDGDAAALERLRSLVGPFVLRRAKDAPEVDLELPPITITKVPCNLTVEQASLYTRDGRPLDAAHRASRADVRPPRCGARDARAAQAGLQPSRARRPHRTAARRPLRQARAARRAPRHGSRGRPGARVHAVPRVPTARAAPRHPARPRGRLLPRRALRPRARRPPHAVRLRDAGRPSSSSRCAREGAG